MPREVGSKLQAHPTEAVSAPAWLRHPHHSRSRTLKFEGRNTQYAASGNSMRQIKKKKKKKKN